MLLIQNPQLRPLVPLVQRINQELDLAVSVPPAAPIDTYVVRLAGLKKAAGSAKPAAKLERENAALKDAALRWLPSCRLPSVRLLVLSHELVSELTHHTLCVPGFVLTHPRRRRRVSGSARAADEP